jgi:ElaB/YqjD/DUF883 family membrane-anchored ribosome-binding protein
MTNNTGEMYQIERELSQSREDLKESVSALGEKLTFGQLIDEVIEKSGFDVESARASIAGAAKLTVPGAILGAGVALLVSNMGSMAKSKSALKSNGHDRSNDDDYDFSADWQAHDRYRAAMNLEAEHGRLPDEDDNSYRRRVRPMQASVLGYNRDEDEDETSFHARVEQGLSDAKEAAIKAGERLSHAAKSAVGGAKAMLHDASDATQHAAAAVSGGVKKSVARAQDFYGEHPTAGIALGLFMGALLGSVVPLSRKEEELLREPVGKGAASLAEAGERVAQDVSRGVHAAAAEHRTSAQPV